MFKVFDRTRFMFKVFDRTRSMLKVIDRTKLTLSSFVLYLIYVIDIPKAGK